MQREELAAWLRLTLAPGVGNTLARRLLATFGMPQQLFEQPLDALEQVGQGLASALNTPAPRLEPLLDATWNWLQAHDGAPRRILTLADPDYPPGLLQTEDPPLILYAMGELPSAWPAAIAVVGSRNPTAQGLSNAHEFARSFAQAGLTVVSGMALGIDGAAHRGALAGAAPRQLATIAVVGTGLDSVYPRQHLELAHEIARRGLIVSEYPLGTPPLAANFPRRNRIIAALADGTVVVEAAVRSGSLITARLAAEQGKEVFAIPGSIHSPQTRGCHALLKEGAKLVETAQDVLDELRMPAAPAAAAAAAAPDMQPRAREDALLVALGFDPVSLDALVARTGVAPSQLLARLLELELQGDVARLPGGLFQRCAST